MGEQPHMNLGQAVPGQAVHGQDALEEWVEASAGSAATPPLSSFLGALLGGALWLEDLPRVLASPCRRERQQAPQALVGLVF